VVLALGGLRFYNFKVIVFCFLVRKLDKRFNKTLKESAQILNKLPL